MTDRDDGADDRSERPDDRPDDRPERPDDRPDTADTDHAPMIDDTTADHDDGTDTDDRTGTDDRTDTDDRIAGDDRDAAAEEEAEEDGLSVARARRILDGVALAALIVLAIVAGWSVYAQAGSAIRTWIAPAYHSVALAAFNLAVLFVALAGVAFQLRRLRDD